MREPFGREIRNALGSASAESKVAFAAACAQRLFMIYEGYCAAAGGIDVSAAADVLARLWRAALESNMELLSERDVEACEENLPPDDDALAAEFPYAEDAIASLIFAVRTALSGDVKDCVRAARRVYDAFDDFVARTVGLQDPNAVASHPLVQEELRRQQRDLDELTSVRDSETEVIGSIKARAELEAHRVSTVLRLV